MKISFNTNLFPSISRLVDRGSLNQNLPIKPLLPPLAFFKGVYYATSAVVSFCFTAVHITLHACRFNASEIQATSFYRSKRLSELSLKFFYSSFCLPYYLVLNPKEGLSLYSSATRIESTINAKDTKVQLLWNETKKRLSDLSLFVSSHQKIVLGVAAVSALAFLYYYKRIPTPNETTNQGQRNSFRKRPKKPKLLNPIEMPFSPLKHIFLDFGVITSPVDRSLRHSTYSENSLSKSFFDVKVNPALIAFIANSKIQPDQFVKVMFLASLALGSRALWNANININSILDRVFSVKIQLFPSIGATKTLGGDEQIDALRLDEIKTTQKEEDPPVVAPKIEEKPVVNLDNSIKPREVPIPIISPQKEGAFFEKQAQNICEKFQKLPSKSGKNPRLDEVQKTVEYINENRAALNQTLQPQQAKTKFVNVKDGIGFYGLKGAKLFVVRSDKQFGNGAFKVGTYGVNYEDASPIAIMTTSFKKDNLAVYTNELEKLKLFKGCEGIIQILGDYTNKFKGIMFLEFAGRGTLKDAMQEKNLTVEKKFTYALQILKGLGKIHSEGVIHRDLKLDNILIMDDDQAKIADFGQAINEKALRDVTNAGNDAALPVGTSAYFPPEDVYNVASIDQEVPDEQNIATTKKDVWAAACLFLILLKQTRPFWWPDPKKKENFWDDTDVGLPEIFKMKAHFDELKKSHENYKKMLPEYETEGTLDNLLFKMLQIDQSKRIDINQALKEMTALATANKTVRGSAHRAI